MVFFHIWGLNSCHMKVPHKLMLWFSHCGAPPFGVRFLFVKCPQVFCTFFAEVFTKARSP